MDKPLTFKTTLPFVITSLILVLGPLFLAWYLTPSGYEFSGALANHNDFSAYIAAVRQGAAGHWLFHFTFSPEQWRPQFMLPMYMIIGKVVPSTFGYVIWINTLRVIALFLTLLIFGVWVRHIFRDAPAKQWTAWLLLVFGGGFGWFLLPLANSAGFPDSAHLFPDITDSGWGLGLIGANAPHYMMGLFLETLFFFSFWQATKNANWKWTGIASISAAVLGLIYVYNTTVLFAAISLYLLWIVWEERRFPWDKWLQGGVILAPVLLQLFYYGYWLNLDPAWAQYAVNAPVPPPPWYALMWGSGIVGILAILGARQWWRTRQNALLIFWIIGNLLVMYIPIVQFSGRFILGLWIPLATLAAYSLEEVVLPWMRQRAWYGRFAKLTPTPYETLRRIILILTMPSGLIVAFFFIQNAILQPEFPVYMPKSEIHAMEWLSEKTNPQTDLILAYYPVGNYLPRLSDTRVFMGQFSMTVNFSEKLGEVQKFWQIDTPDSWRLALLRDWGITHIYHGRYENALHQGEIVPPGMLVYDKDGIKIYQINP